MAVRARVEVYRKPLVAPFVTSRGTITEREGCLFLLAGPDGIVGRGEAAPAYWIDGEPIAQVRAALEKVVRVISDSSCSLLDVEEALLSESSVAPKTGRLAAVRAELAALPSARAAIDSACLELTALRAGRSVAAVLGGGGDIRSEVSALLTAGDAGEVFDEIRRRARQGYQTVKLKTGAMSVETDAERLSAAVRVCEEFRMRLRVDANRAWTLAEAVHVFKGIDCECIEFVEEPLARPEPRELCRLRDELSVPIALDESLEGNEVTRRFAESGAMNIAVVKPARFGGLRASLAAAAVAAKSSVKTVFTDSIETEVGTAAVAHLAAAYRAGRDSEPAAAIGLGGLVFLAEQSLAAPIVELTASGPGLGVERTCGEL